MVQNHYIQSENIKTIIFKVKTLILHQFTWLKASVVGILSGIEYTTVGFSSVVKINWYNVPKCQMSSGPYGPIFLRWCYKFYLFNKLDTVRL